MVLQRTKDHPVPLPVINALRSATPQGEVAVQVPTASLSRWRIGGLASVLVEPGNSEELAALLTLLANEPTPVCVIGDGSNLLFDTKGFNGIVLVVGRRFSSMRTEGTRVTAGAGIAMPELARAVGHAGLSGIEHTVGIPGTLGGLVLMNGGSLRRGIGTHVTSVRCIDSTGAHIELSQAECEFAYRSSLLQTLGAVVIEVDLQLERGDALAIEQEMDKIVADRAAKFPLDLPNCGSTFVSDPALYQTIGPPGKAIEAVGLKGTRRGDVQISEQHANFFVNLGRGTSDDALWLIALARNSVREQTGIAMKCEVRYVSPNGDVRPAHEEAERRWGTDLLRTS